MKHFFLKICCCILVLSIGLTHSIVAQEGVELRGLQVNTALINAKKTPQKKNTPPLLLPFFDDFSSLHSPYPNPALWQDNMVFVNADFPIFPPTIGVATFDALDANGWVYRHASIYPFEADTLTSQPIRLDSIFTPNPHRLTARDSIYLSFYYQPGGGFGRFWEGNMRGRAPAKNDRFILEFLNNTGHWDLIWDVNGQTLEEFCPLCVTDTAENLKTFFKQVMIPITDARYFHSNFQFRFRNVSSLDRTWRTGGQWHLDYVRLAHNRSANDVFSGDIAFVDRAQRVLKNFQAMPIKQFRAATDLVSEIPLVFRNLDQAPQVAEYQYRIFNQNKQVVWTMTPPSNANIFPFHSHGFNSDPDISKPQLLYQFPNITNAQTFTVQHILKRTGSQDICATNDTMQHSVHFGNFYAYDDGTPEAGFGFVGANSQFAYRFPLRVFDTLVAIQIWFNHTLEDMRFANLNLAVWNANNDSTPSTQPIYIGQTFTPTYNETIGFQTYVLSRPIILDTGSFFIGFQQQSNVFLNIGFDQNNNAENRMLRYGLDHDGVWKWMPIFYYGSVMMRPIFGTATPTGIRERGVVAENITVYPNPSDGTIFVESPESAVISYEIYDLNGRRLLQRTSRNTHFSITLPERPGVYILLLNTENGIISQKIIRR